MADSEFVFEEGDPIFVGSHGDHDFVFANGAPVSDTGESTFVFEAGTGLSAELLVFDSFEDGDLSEYKGFASDGGTSFAATKSGPKPIDGDWILRSDGAPFNDGIFSRSGLAEYPSRGNVVEFYIYHTDPGAQAGFMYGFQDDSNFYYAQVRTAKSFNDEQIENGLFLQKDEYVVGNEIAGDSSWDPPDHLNEWIRVRISWASDGTHMLTAETVDGTELASCSGADSEYTGNGLAWVNDDLADNDGVVTYFDYARTTT